MKDLERIKRKMSGFGDYEFKMHDFMKFIKEENKKKEKIKLWYAPIPYKGMAVPPGYLVNGVKTKRFHIVIDDRLDRIDQEFTFAHELSHYLLNHHKPEVYYGEMCGNKIELLANIVCILFKLPKTQLFELWPDIERSDASDYGYELANNLMDNLKGNVKELIKMKSIPLRDTISDRARSENMDKITKRINMYKDITKIKTIIDTILVTYPK